MAFEMTIVCDYCKQTTVQSATLPANWFQISVTEGQSTLINDGQYCTKAHAVAAVTAAINGTT